MLTKPGETMFNSTKTALTYLAEGLRHELSHSESKIKVTVSFFVKCMQSLLIPGSMK